MRLSFFNLLDGHTSHHVRILMFILPVESSHAIPTFSFFGIGFLFCTLCHTGGLRIVILLLIPCIPTLITGRESVMPCCANPGFTGILLCGFMCLLTLCILVTSDSPHEPILLIASMTIYDSTHAVLPHIQLCATFTFS